MAFLQPAKRRILVVDDNADAATILAALLRHLGHEVEVAHEGTAAIAIARRMRPEFLFLDLAMPGFDGFRVAETLRNEPVFEKLFIVALTGLAMEEDRQRSRDVGIDVYLIKPPDPRFIESLVGNARFPSKGP